MSPLPLPPVAAPYQLPFHYGALHNIGLDYLVHPDPVREVLAKHHPALTAADFAGYALVSLNYQLYFAQYPNGGGITQEIEVNIVAHPAAAADRVPRVSYAQYAQGHDQTKLLGIGRVHVLCDNPLAIEAGRLLYAEPKYPGTFSAEMPSLNGPAGDAWNIHCHAADATPLFSLAADLNGLRPVTANNTPITGYGTEPDGRTLAGPMNVYQPYHWYDLTAPEAAGRARLTVHDPSGAVGQDLTHLIHATAPAGAWTFQSPPVAAHNRPYYLA
ncbi:hypothetical protein OHS33_34285 [Streptomyces sp. NBC_00536]|uniref:hypothetical protein n=1 Tax=Streptomyces sp. NBC_00536 TaxID=2975769 RepID=UPI002E80D72B|nr:hypothetical protein [Streptomyces sp. NBC_00536]WUC82991.1 hypothetical protein OHS33_34285 [Streptomyces sp. NBC_00536]